jgi:hypothetical protein
MSERVTWIALAVVALCGAIVVVRVKAAPAPNPAAGKLDERGRRAVALDVATRENDWRRESAENFPRDHWSQSDDFHAREAKRVREIAGERRVPYEDVLRAIDDDLHRIGPSIGALRGGSAVPCKPRPFYD